MNKSLNIFFKMIFGVNIPTEKGVYYMPYIHLHKEWHDWQVRKVIKKLTLNKGEIYELDI